MRAIKDEPTITHPDYDATAPERQLYCDVLKGTIAMRNKNYLPKFPLENDESYGYRLMLARAFNVVGKTLATFCGLVFRKPIMFGEDVPTQIRELSENIDNQGNHLDIFARQVFEDSYDGWAVILTDSPAVRVHDLAEQQQLGLRPYLTGYKAADVPLWDYQINQLTKKRELSLIVLREHRTVRRGVFLRETLEQYRVFQMIDGRVYWQLWEEQKNNSDGKTKLVQIVNDTLLPEFDMIPIAIIGKLGARPPMAELAYSNLDHTRTYSDYKSILHKTCVPVPFTTGLDAAEAGKAIAGDMMWCLPQGGTFQFAEVAGGSIAAVRACLEDLKIEMSWLGLQMLAPQPKNGSQATATEVISDTIQDTSELQVRATQLKDALELSLMHIAKYMKLAKGGSLELGCSWDQMLLSNDEINTLSGLVAEGHYSLESLLWQLEKGGKLPPDITAERELERIKADEEEAARIRPVINALNMPNGKVITNETNAEGEQKETTQPSAVLPNTGSIRGGVSVGA